MKISIYALFVGAMSFALYACGNKDNGDLSHHHHHGEEAAAHASHNHDHSHEANDPHDHGEEDASEAHSDEIVLSAETAQQFNVATEEIQPQTFNEVIEVAGQIVDSPNSTSIVAAPTSGIIKFGPSVAAGKEVSNGSVIATISAANVSGGDGNKSAQAALEAAKKELERIEPLYKDKLVTAKQYNEAVAAYEQAKAAYSPSAASGAVRASAAGVITSLNVQNGQYVNAGDIIASISGTRHLTLRADMPEKYYSFLPTVSTANIIMPYSNETIALADLNGKRVASNQAVSAQRGYVPVYFTFDNNGKVIPGSIATVKLIGAPISDAITVPLSALSEQQGEYFVYKQLDEEGYEKSRVRVGNNDGLRVRILDGVAAGDNVVTEGVVALRLAETSAVAPEGHSH